MKCGGVTRLASQISKCFYLKYLHPYYKHTPLHQNAPEERWCLGGGDKGDGGGEKAVEGKGKGDGAEGVGEEVTKAKNCWFSIYTV